MANPVIYPSARLAGMMIDFFEELRTGAITEDQFQSFLRKRNPFEKNSNSGHELFDEQTYFKTRPGLSVDPDLDRDVCLKIGPTNGLESLKWYDLERNSSEAEIFGKPGSLKRQEIMDGLPDLGQISLMIEEQYGGRSGKLLNDGKANLFPIKGKKGELRLVVVYWLSGFSRWYVFCYPWCESRVWRPGNRVFSNKS